VFLNRGDHFDAIPSSAEYAAVGDMDGDGKQDLVSSGDYSGRNAHVYLSNGDGTFRDAGPYAPRGSVLLQDRNGDGRLDIVVTREEAFDPDNYSVNVVFNRTETNHAPIASAAYATLA